MLLKIRVRTESKSEKVSKTGQDSLEIFVREPARENMANKRVLELIRARFGRAGKRIRIVSGHHSASKIIKIDE